MTLGLLCPLLFPFRGILFSHLRSCSSERSSRRPQTKNPDRGTDEFPGAEGISCSTEPATSYSTGDDRRSVSAISVSFSRIALADQGRPPAFAARNPLSLIESRSLLTPCTTRPNRYLRHSASRTGLKIKVWLVTSSRTLYFVPTGYPGRQTSFSSSHAPVACTRCGAFFLRSSSQRRQHKCSMCAFCT